MIVSGRVQGVGFRPFVYQLASNYQLQGWVRNRTGSVEVHIEGEPGKLFTFTRELLRQAPPLASPRLDRCTPVAPVYMRDFHIRESETDTGQQVFVPPDLYTCTDCLAELADPQDRRYRYPFINCTNCGPRYTLIRELPYDRANTTMSAFELCPDCRKEYSDPRDRRFHAEPVACPSCGPELEFIRDDEILTGNERALRACVNALADGLIVAVKGVGGYHIMCDARNDAAINRLRTHKQRPHKPLAVMFPAPAGKPLSFITRSVCLARDQADLLLSPARPIVLVNRQANSEISAAVAPGLDEIGIMLPYSPLHHLLLNDFGHPLVATSGNISGEPVLTDNDSVMRRLGHVVDAYLHHNRPIARPADDPVYRFINDRPRPLRLGRGNAPLELELPVTLEQPVIATGGHMKNTVALAWDNRVVISPHIGELDNAHSRGVFEQTITDLQALYRVSAAAVICDRHPGYASTLWANRCGLPVHRILHHHAHAATAYDFSVSSGPQLVFTWDGTGYGEDGTLWGGEAFLGSPGQWRRVASLRPFSLPGGERAGREPWRSAAALCWESGHDWPAQPDNADFLHQAWQRRLNTPQSSAVGRLFDAAAALTGTCTHASYEGQGPMLLEAIAHGQAGAVELPLTADASGLLLTDWEPLLPVLLDDGQSVAARAGCLHASLAAALHEQARAVRATHGVTRVGLSGGVFQNRLLTSQVVRGLQADGFSVCFPSEIPVNDAGICFGQVLEYGFSAQPT
ncbi:MAG: carbamoyltransferase HypF [Gammaproteobacteria bacterium]|nr:carbamoyltransferase HypF [Gammaproteobacteria bacterium]